MKRIERLVFERSGGQKEVDALRHLQASDKGGHDNVVRYIDKLDIDKQFVFIVMTLCDQTLEERMRDGALAEWRARHVACRELCTGLAYLHELKEPIAHRDIKPSNVPGDPDP